MKIKFISVETTDKKTKTNKDYVELDVTYKNCDFQEKVESKKLNPFGNKDVYNTLKNAKTGDFFEVERVKNEGGFWDWIKISAVDGSNTSTTSTVASGSKTTVAPKSTYETAEERAQRQILIVKQSAIAQAVATLSVGAKKLSSADVLPVAQEYYDWVFGTTSAPIPLADLPVVGDEGDEDIPY